MAGSSILARMAVIIDGQTANFNKAMAQSQGTLKSFEGALGKTNSLLTSFGVGFGVFQVKEFLSDVIDVTAQFEKFGAVLANTLGSQGAAQAALDSIRVFAQETPFEVAEVTAAYVRWANQGLSPTIDKMTKLGDVASSLGAGFEQTAEAFKDLLVGQTKRIEEIGISATQSNGKIQLSFKGVNLEIDKTVEGVEQALNTFSALQGVQGTSAQVAETLGGRISNLKDAYSNLLLTVGTGSGGALKDSVNVLISITNAASNLISKLSDTSTAFGKTAEIVVNGFIGPTKFLLSLLDNTEEVNKKLAENDSKLKAIQSTADAAFDSGNIEAYIKALDQNIFKEEIIIEIRRRQAADLVKQKPVIDDHVKSLKKLADVETIAAGSLDAYRETLKDLNNEFDKTNDNDLTKLRNLSAQIVGTETLIKRLQQLKSSGINELNIPAPDTSAFLDPISKVTKTEGAVTFDLDQALSDSMVERFEARLARTAKATAKTTEEIKRNFVSLTTPITNAVAGIAEAIGSAIAGVGNFGEDILKVVAGFGKQLGQILIAEGVALLAAKLALKNPYTAIAAGVALVAISSALSAGISKAHSSAFGGSGSSGRDVTNTPRLNPQVQSGQSIQFNAKFRLEGNDLVASINSTNKQNGRLTG